MSDLTLAQILTAMTPTDAGWTAPAPDNWKQGRTAFGGYTAAMLLEAARRSTQDLPPLRSALVNFTGPVVEDPVLSATMLRQGRNIAMVGAQAHTGADLVATATFAFGKAQDSAIAVSRPAPDAPSPSDCEPYIPSFAAAMAPGYQRSFDMRLIDGDRPMMGSDRPYLRCWVRHKDPASRTGIVSLMCIADILPPGVLPMFRKLGPNSSVNWICNILTETHDTDDGWWQAETQATAAADGYSSQVMRMWNSRGDLVVDGMQSVVIFV